MNIFKTPNHHIKFNTIFHTWAGAAIKPTAIPHATRPTRMAMWLYDSAITPHPHNNGIIERSSVFFRPYASIIGTDTSEPMGVASEWIDAGILKKKRREDVN